MYEILIIPSHFIFMTPFKKKTEGKEEGELWLTDRDKQELRNIKIKL